MDILSSYSNSAIAGLLAVILFSYYLLRRSRVGLPKKAPIAAGAWPIIGHLPLLGGTNTPHITLGAMAEKYGPIFTIHLGLQRALVISSWEMAKECFTTNDLAVSSRPKFVAAKHFGYNFALFSFAPYGPYWRDIRKIATSELLSNRRLEILSYVRVSEVETTLQELYKVWTKKKESGQILVELKQWFGDMSLNVILRMVAGKRYFSTTAVADEVHEEESQRIQKLVREFFHYIGMFVVSDTIPCLGWLDLGGHEKAMKKAAKELDGLLGKWLEEHKRKRAAGEDKEDKDFMDVMLSVLDGKDVAGYDADTINKATCLNIILGGADTNTVTIIWAISLLLNNRQVLKKAQEELDIHVGKERALNESDINQLVYLQAIVKEALRLYPAAPLSGPREFSKDCIIGGYHVPKGTRLITNIWKIQIDPRIWSDPLAFKPERFLTAQLKDVDLRGKSFELIPFGSGRRVCPGISFGLQMVHLTLASFLHRYDISTPSNAPVDMTESLGLTNLKATPLEVLITPRLPSFRVIWINDDRQIKFKDGPKYYNDRIFS
ncbi:cytochrome P450 82A3-like [Corylus avellana]|uniref:cytochrome P450 82A3-like n=1 Tax=Corylus avellana TaxID=13451 RepID=UPI00286BEF9F|nr:cytochrome P450 82A3-like [Corylus avellana]